MADGFAPDVVLVVFNKRGKQGGIDAMSSETTGPILQETEDNPLWETMSATYNGVVLVDRRGLVAYAHNDLPMPEGEPRLRAEVAALVAEDDGS